MVNKTEWLCIDCGRVLGNVLGGELKPAVPPEQIITRGPNLVITCPECGFVKSWYTSDPIVKAVYQLVDAMSYAHAKRVLHLVSEGSLPKSQKN
jgi:hypothetical protein